MGQRRSERIHSQAGERERLLGRGRVRAIDGEACLFEPPYARESNVSPLEREQKDDRTSRKVRTTSNRRRPERNNLSMKAEA